MFFRLKITHYKMNYILMNPLSIINPAKSLYNYWNKIILTKTFVILANI
jgi:hypothetical protein